MGAITVLNDDFAAPYGEVALDGGDRLALSLDRNGLLIRNISDNAVIYRANADTTSAICASLSSSRDPIRPSPLKILAALVSRMPTAAEVSRAFRSAESALSA